MIFISSISSLIFSCLVIMCLPPLQLFALTWVYLWISCILFLLYLDFIALTIIIVYVGAVSILFLFALTTLESESELKDTPIDTLFIAGISPPLAWLYSITIWVLLNINPNIYYVGYEHKHLSNLMIIAFQLFDHFFFLFVIASLILLIALIAAIASFEVLPMTPRSG